MDEPFGCLRIGKRYIEKVNVITLHFILVAFYREKHRVEDQIVSGILKDDTGTGLRGVIHGLQQVN